MRVLLAVGSSDLRLALDLFLREQPGMLVMGATCRSEGALALLRTMEFDLVLLQWSLPGLPVSAVLGEPRHFSHRPRFLVLGDRTADEDAASSAGADAFVLVGDPPQELLGAIEALSSMANTEQPTDASIG
jgi:DNA-binding NarL/FixJ family response regulator